MVNRYLLIQCLLKILKWKFFLCRVVVINCNAGAMRKEDKHWTAYGKTEQGDAQRDSRRELHAILQLIKSDTPSF